MPHQRLSVQHTEHSRRNFTQIEIPVIPRLRGLWRSSTSHMRCCLTPTNAKSMICGLLIKCNYRRNRLSRVFRLSQYNNRHHTRRKNQKRPLAAYSPTSSETGMFMESQLSYFGFGRLTNQKHLHQARSHIKPVRHHLDILPHEKPQFRAMSDTARDCHSTRQPFFVLKNSNALK